MKKFIVFFLMLFVIIGCRDDDFGNGNNTLQPVSFKVQTKYDESFENKPSSGASVTLTNTSTGDVYTQTTDANGDANFANVIPGNYNILVSRNMSQADFLSTFGFSSPTQETAFNGTQENATINANVNSTVVVLKSSRVGDLVIKQIYYAGSHATQGASLRDQFIEIFNNSNEVIYADGLYIAQLYGKTNTTVNATSQANGQFDWSKSLGMTIGSAANTDYVYADYVFRIPGNGTQYPIQPGASIVIAQSAVNHTAPLLDNSGNPINVQNPALTIDLSNANFEAFLGDFRQSIGLTTFNTDIQNPAVQDLQIAFWGRVGYYNGNKDMILDTLGRDSFVIFRADNFDTYGDYSDPTVSVIGTNTSFYKQIPNSVIIDGVELQHYNPNSQRPKMLQGQIDASSINTDAAFNSQSVIRKVKTTLSNGRKILEDTNNTASDFVKLSKANPYGFAP